MRIELGLRWHTQVDGARVEIDESLFALLRAVAAGGSLNFAAKELGVSYRHAWGLVRTWEERIGSPLLASRQGRGTNLTAFGSGLLVARDEAERDLAQQLAATALRAGARMEAAITSDCRRVRIASSHGDRIAALREHLVAENRDVALEIVGSEGALRHYRRGDADVAGFHLPMGALGRSVAAKLIGMLDDRHDALYLLDIRALGLMSRQQDPIRDLAALAGGEVRFVNRQPGSATRLTFDGLLGEQGIAPGDIRGYRDEEYTHTAVAALVVSRDVDAAFGAEEAARHFDLCFVPMVEERFYIVVNRAADSAVRQAVAEFCAALEFEHVAKMKADERTPSVAVLKRVHRAGFWKSL